MNYPEAVEYIDSFINYEKTASWNYPEALKLDRMRALAKELGNPQNAFDSVIVAGSKGKGSTAAILSSIFRMENLKVGLYTSPHLVDLRERIQVNGLLISELRFTEIVEMLRRVLNDYAWRKNPPTYFEMLTAIAFYHFKQMKIHVAVLEVGLGGLYDSTNIANAKVAGITPVSLEHTDKLGKTVSKIAVQKCGIIKGREIVVSGMQVPEAEAVIVKTAGEKEAELFRVGKEIKLFDRTHGGHFQKFDVKTPFGNYYELELRLLGAHQIENAAQAIGLAKAYEKKSLIKISDAAVHQGILDAHWPGRLEKISDRPLVLLDGAQNADSARRAIEAAHRHFDFHRLIVILGVSADKDLSGILEEILPAASVVIATQSENPRALAAEAIAERAKESGKEVHVEKESAKALEKAAESAGPDDLILVTGSLYLVGEFKREGSLHGFERI